MCNWVSLDVVPAKAGTHTPRPRGLVLGQPASSPTDIGGYGSLLSQGRRKARRRTPPSYPAHAGYPVRRGFSISITDVSGILDHPLSRVMTTRFKFQTATFLVTTASRSRGAIRPSFCYHVPPWKSEGAGNAGR